MATLTRTATCRAGQAVDTATGELLTPAVLVERVGWLGGLVAEVAQSVLDTHWDRVSIEALTARTLPTGARTPLFAYKASAALWGWQPVPPDVYAVSRVVWMGMELAGRQLRSAGYRMAVVDQVVSGAESLAGDPVTVRNTRRQVGRFKDTHGRLPRDLFELAPASPAAPQMVPLAATDKQFSTLEPADGNASALLMLLLPLVPRPATQIDWSRVQIAVAVPPRYRAGRLRPPTLRVHGPHVRVDLPVEFPKPTLLPDNGVVLGVDWGVNRLLTATRVLADPTGVGAPSVDGRPLFFDPSPLLSKAARLGRERERVRAKRDAIERLLARRPDPALHAKLAVLDEQVARLSRKQSALNKQIPELAAVWLVEQAKAAGAHTIAVEDLRTLEHRGLGKRTNVRVSAAMRGRTRDAIANLCELEGLRLRDVTARGTSSFCSRCTTKVTHYTAPNGPAGHNWMRCPGCMHQAPRDLPAAENIGRRAAAPAASRVRHRRTKKTHLAPAPNPARGPKTGPTPKQATQTTRAARAYQARQRPGDAATSPHRSAGPRTQGSSIAQSWTEITCPSTRRVDSLRCAYRHTLRATPVKYRSRTLGVTPA